MRSENKFEYSNFNAIFAVIEIASGEYGLEYVDKMTEFIDNGRVISWKPSADIQDRYTSKYNYSKNTQEDFSQFEEEINPSNLKMKCSSFQQFLVLFRRASKQIYRNRVRLPKFFAK